MVAMAELGLQFVALVLGGKQTCDAIHEVGVRPICQTASPALHSCLIFIEQSKT